MKAGHSHHQHQADGDDRALPDIDHRERGARADSHDLIALHRLVITVCLHGFCIEIFDSFVIQKRIDGTRRRLFVGIIHLAPEPDPPLRDPDGEIAVGHHGDEGHGGIEPTEHRPHDDADEDHLDEQRQHLEKDDRQQEFDSLRPTVDGAGQPASLAIQMELQRQPVKIFETADRGTANRPLRHRGEQILLGFGKYLLAKPRQRVAGDDQQQHFQRKAGILIDKIDGGAIHQRRDDV